MIVSRLSQYIYIYLTVFIPSFPYFKEYTKGLGGKQEEQDSKFWKGLRISLITIGILGAAWTLLVPVPFAVNGIYKDVEGVVQESRYTGEEADGLSNYGVTMIETDTGEVWKSAMRSDQAIKKGAVVEVREYNWMTFFPVIAIRIDGEETEYYKENKDDFTWNPTFDRIMIGIFVIINILVHVAKYHKQKKTRSTTRKGRVLCKTWNYGCILFCSLMLVCVWWPICTSIQAYVWGYTLMFVFVMYQLAGYAHILESAGFVWESRVEICQSDERCLENSKAELEQMDCVNSEKYCTYKSKKGQRKYWRRIVTAGIADFVFVSCILKWEDDAKWILIAAIIIATILLNSFWICSMQSYRRILKNMQNNLAEYAIMPIKYDEKQTYICADGSIITYTLKWLADSWLGDDEEVVAIYLPWEKKIFIEERERLEAVLMQNEISGEQSADENPGISLEQMSLADSEKYGRYKYKKRVKSYIENAVLLSVFNMGVVLYLLVESKFVWLITAEIGIVVATIIGVMLIFRKRNGKLKDSIGSQAEYAVLIAAFYKNIKLVCTDGTIVVREMRMDDDVKIKDGEEAVIVYFPKTNLMFTEEVHTLNDILGIKIK